MSGVLMDDLYREDSRGCLLWCAFMFGCPGLAMLSIIIEEQAGLHLRNVEWLQSGANLVVLILIIAGGYLVLRKLIGSPGESVDRPGYDNHLDRGAGTMNWDDHGDSGSE
jgi:hypothetical protein